MSLQVRLRLYGLQQRVAITNREAAALMVVIGVLLAGSILQWRGIAEVAVDPDTYEELDAAFAAGARKALDPAEAEYEEEVVATVEATQVGGAHGGGSATRPSRLPPVRLDPNTAPSSQLQRLPGIGPALAERIIAHREEVGPFARPRDLTRVRGIGERTLERFEAYIYIEPAAIDQAFGGSAAASSGEAPTPFVP